ncbi:flagellar protein FliT [Vibrio hangzhouensis]|uniref:flagellar protein FliT n=1 Tax=Vibrio hangzhouensis TaxID=462991 RepID=UPI0021BBE5AF|nr:flagellar protein FliT [Vibrio hangzhouensis]
MDHRLLSVLENIDVDTEEIHQLVDTREQIINKLVVACQRNPNLKQSTEWQQVVESTRRISHHMQKKTEQLGLTLKKYRHGKRSLQQYQKYI